MAMEDTTLREHVPGETQTLLGPWPNPDVSIEFRSADGRFPESREYMNALNVRKPSVESTLRRSE